MVNRFRQEAITVANMSHPHIITIHAVRQMEDLHFFVMKFVEGRSLEHIVRSSGPLPIPTVRGLLWMVGNALAYGHRRGVVHRDVKPANILVDEDGNAIVTDFGIAKLVMGDSIPRTSLGGQTQTGIIVGTPTYMSPEQCLARPVSAASDQYSLGLVAYELLTGRPPFTGSPFVVMHAHTERPAAAIRDQRPDCDPELDAAVLRMLAKEPAQRWPSVQHALAALGASPLGDADPGRLELARLSIPEPFRRSDEILQVTPSPAPAGGNRGGAGGAPAEPRPYVAAVEIFAPPQVVEIGDSFTLRASPRNPSGDTMPGVRVRWTSGDERIATIDEAGGLVQARAAGEVEITATAGGIRNAVKVTVVPKRVAAINLSLPPGVVHVGDRVQLVAMPEDKHHESVPTTVHWSCADESIAVVGEDGVVSAKAPGLALVWAESQGVRGMARIEVTPAAVAAVVVETAPDLLETGESAELRAIAVDESGTVLTDRPLRWKSSDPAVADVLNDRVVHARRAGVAHLTCASEGKTAAITVNVVAGAVAKVVISPAPALVDLGLPFTLSAEVISERGLPLDRAIAWRSESPRTAAVDAHGVVLPLAPGPVTIIASVEGTEDSIHFDVNPAPQLVVPTVDLSATQRFELSEVRRMLGQTDVDDTAVDAEASLAESRTRSDAPDDEKSVESLEAAIVPDRALVDEDAEAGAVAPEDEGVERVAPATADEGSSFAESPDAPAVTNEEELVASEAAEEDDLVAAGGSLPLAEDVDPLFAEPRPPSFLERVPRRRLAMAGGGAVVLALALWAIWPSGKKASDTQLTTSPGAVADPDTSSPAVLAGADSSTRVGSDSAVVSSDSTASTTGASIALGTLRQIRVGDSALARGRVVGDTAHIVWASSSPKIASVNPATGRVVGVGIGTATITARAGTATATMRLRVLPAASATLSGRQRLPVAQLIATEVSSSLREGDTIRLTAAPLDEHGGSLLDRKVTWRSERPEVASVDEWGLVTTHHAGKVEIVATAEQQSVRVPIAVVARPVVHTDVAAGLRARADEFQAALTAHDAERLTALYFPGTSVESAPAQDRKNLDWLLARMQQPAGNFRVTRAQLGRPGGNDAESVTELALRLAWTEPSGKNRETNVKFRVRFTKGSEGWLLDGIRATGRLD